MATLIKFCGEVDSVAHLCASFAVFAVCLEELNAKDAKETA
jgi:hypothetical protein